MLLTVQVTWNKNGNWLVSCSRDQTIKLYDIRTMKDMCTFKVLYYVVCTEGYVYFHLLFAVLLLSGVLDYVFTTYKTNCSDVL